ncbi:GAF domain-containing protein [Sphingobacterium cellulitidis]|uniref:GAF domain-containing protein n=1 Tax=Sphingobacterium cellulitidis TaxID=1768011 RepID=UPI003C7DFD35
MAEDLQIAKGNKEEQYQSLLPQIKGLLHGETNLIANLGNICAALKEQFDFFWVGFYLVEGNELVLGPFQGPVACTRIAHNRGVCGTAWAKEETLIVPNVDEFPGHIACSSLSKSEIVLAVFMDGKCMAILDIDSKDLNSFDLIDKQYLIQILELLNSK